MKCPNCNSEVLPGLSFCEECNSPMPKNAATPSPSYSNTTMNYEMGSNVPSPSPFPSNQTETQTHTFPDGTKQETPKQGIIEVVANKPKMFVLKEIRGIILAWTIVILGFSGRKIFLTRNPNILAILVGTALAIFLIFGVWLILDKIASRFYRIYTEFSFDGNRAFLSFVASFIFIGIPPLHPKYRVWMKKPPKVQDIPKIQLITFGGLLIWAYLILNYFYFIGDTSIFLNNEYLIYFLYIPFILGLSIGINLLPFRGTPGWLIYSWNKVMYYGLAGLTTILLVFSYLMLTELLIFG
jgi:hypothetical protein